VDGRADGHRAGSDDVVIDAEAAVPRRAAGRRRWVTGVAAAMLVAAAGGAGFGLGRAAGDGGDEVRSAADPAEVLDTRAPVTTSAPVTTQVAVPVDTTVAAEPAVEVGAIDVPAGSVTPGGMYGQAPMTLVYTRELADGLRIRALRGAPWEQPPYQSGWQPEPFCMANAELRVTLDSPDVVDVTSLGSYAATETVQVERSVLGAADGRPLRILVVHHSAAGGSVTVEWSDGPSDTTELVDGLAVLVTEGGADPWSPAYDLQLHGDTGMVTIGSAEIENRYSQPEWREACVEPPPALPEPGEQPADPAAERAAIGAAFERLWSRDVPRDDKQALLDDWTGVAEAIDAVDAGAYAEAAASAVHTIEELVFTSPTTAWFRYSIESSISDFFDRYGTGEFVDGSWRFPRALICQDLGLAGASCEPPVEPIYPPAWYERYGPVPPERCMPDGQGGTMCETCTAAPDGGESCAGWAEAPARTIAPVVDG
jgi:hypothetical protein